MLDRVSEAGAEASLEDARVVVVGGRGIGGPEGLGVVEELAALLHGVVGATRASVDAGWVPYARLMRDGVRRVSMEDYVAAAYLGGLSRSRILLRHVLPNTVRPTVAFAAIDMMHSYFARAPRPRRPIIRSLYF